jgi:ribosomal protein S19E (S16A)
MDKAYDKFIEMAEQYIRDAKEAQKLNWIDCVKTKLHYAELTLNLASYIAEQE